MFNKNKGFTLVEIMIVVGIIAILAGIFLVGGRSFRDAANDSRRKADLQKIASLQELCYTKSGNYADGAGALETCVGIAPPDGPTTGESYTVTQTNASATLSDGSTYTISW